MLAGNRAVGHPAVLNSLQPDDDPAFGGICFWLNAPPDNQKKDQRFWSERYADRRNLLSLKTSRGNSISAISGNRHELPPRHAVSRKKCIQL